MPHGVMAANPLRSALTLSAKPCQVTQRRMPTPIEPILRAPTHTPVSPSRRDTDVAERVDQDLLETTHVPAHVGLQITQADDGIADQLARTVIGDLSASSDPDDRHGSARRRTDEALVRPAPERVDGRML